MEMLVMKKANKAQVEKEVSAEELSKALKVKSKVRAGALGRPPVLQPGFCQGCGMA
jgi:hypothetical protein